MSAAASTHPPVVQVPAAPIGFRPEGPAAAGSVVVLGAVAAVLVLAVVGLWFAQRRGWLKAWTVVAPPAARRLVIEERIRLSSKTVVYRVRDAEHAFHVVESTAHITVHRP